MAKNRYMHLDRSIFMNTNQVDNTSVFFNFKQHLIKAFFDNIKTDNREFFNFCKICRYGYQKSRKA